MINFFHKDPIQNIEKEITPPNKIWAKIRKFFDFFSRDPIKQIAKRTQFPTEADLDEVEQRHKRELQPIQINFEVNPIPKEARISTSQPASFRRGGQANVPVDLPVFVNGDKVEILTEPKDINKRLWILADRRSRQPGRYQQMPT